MTDLSNIKKASERRRDAACLGIRMRMLPFAMLCCVGLGTLRAQPSLKITSPTDGALVNPGQTVKVSVTAVGTFQQVMIIGWKPIGGSMPRSSPPYEFEVQIPEHINPGQYLLTAVGARPPAEGTHSTPVTIVVELADGPVSLKVQPSFLRISKGGKHILTTYGVFPDGQRADLSKSSQISFASSSPGIATVDHQGVVTPVAEGAAIIKITYKSSTVEVPVTVLPKRPSY
jgi:hypothetical protein